MTIDDATEGKVDRTKEKSTFVQQISGSVGSAQSMPIILSVNSVGSRSARIGIK